MRKLLAATFLTFASLNAGEIETKPPVSAPDENLVKEMERAVYKGDNSALTYLLAKDKNLANIRFRGGITPLMVAALAADNAGYTLAETLLENGARINDTMPGSEVTALHLSIVRYNFSLVDLFLEKGADVNARYKADTVDQNGKPSFIAGYTALMLAADMGDQAFGIARLLLKHGADQSLKNAAGETAFDRAKLGSPKILKILDVQQSSVVAATPEELARKRFERALMTADTNTVREVLAETKGEAVNWRFKDDCTPLMIAAGRGDDEAAAILIAAKADINARDRLGRTPLMFAALALDNKGYKTALLLLETGAHSNDKLPSNDMTALHFAILRKNIELVDILLQDGLSANVPFKTIMKDKDGKDTFVAGHTPLMLAADMGDGAVNIAKLLLKYRADKSLKNERGETALDRARQSSPLILQLLEDKPKAALTP